MHRAYCINIIFHARALRILFRQPSEPKSMCVVFQNQKQIHKPFYLLHDFWAGWARLSNHITATTTTIREDLFIALGEPVRTLGCPVGAFRVNAIPRVSHRFLATYTDFI